MALATKVAPVDEVLRSVNRVIGENVPSLAVHLQNRPQPKLFGLNSGFFYFPIASLLEVEPDAHDIARELAVSLAFGHSYFYCLDRMLDDREVDHPLILAAPFILREYTTRLSSLLTGVEHASNLVNDWHLHYYRTYVEAQIYEWEVSGQLPALSRADLDLLGQKSAPVCLPLRVIHARAERTANLPSTEDSFLTYSAGLQLMDDMSDIVADYQNRLSSVPLRLILGDVLQLKEWPTMQEVSSEDIRLLGNNSGVLKVVLSLATDYFESSREKAIAAGQQTLARLSEDKIRSCAAWMESARE
jgi:hypothetical protein